QVGLAVDANDAAGAGAMNAATFSDVSVGTFRTDLFLKQSGPDFRNGHGAGDDVNLRGVNLGGWLLHENWIDQSDSSGLPDDVAVWNTLQGRFGEATGNRLAAAFEDNWITTRDLDNLAAAGLNLVRVPFS